MKVSYRAWERQKKWLKPVNQVLRYRKPMSPAPRRPVRAKYSIPVWIDEIDTSTGLSTEKLLDQWKVNGRVAKTAENNRIAEELKARQEDLVRICRNILYQDNEGTLDSKTNQSRAFKLLKIDIPDLKDCEIKQLSWIAHGCYKYDDYLAPINHYLSQHLNQKTLATGAGYLMTVLENASMKTQFIGSLQDTPGLEAGIILTLGHDKNLTQVVQRKYIEELFPPEKLTRVLVKSCVEMQKNGCLF